MSMSQVTPASLFIVRPSICPRFTFWFWANFEPTIRGELLIQNQNPHHVIIWIWMLTDEFCWKTFKFFDAFSYNISRLLVVGSPYTKLFSDMCLANSFELQTSL
jgi:hypothetical protein